MNKKSGFTLIEMIVILAILAFLTVGVLWLYENSQQQMRDLNRIENLQTVKTALANYFADNNHYPSGTESDLKILISPKKYIDTIPSGIKYQSANKNNSRACSSNCLSYHLGIQLERMDNEVLFTDDDVNIGFGGSTIDCGSIYGTFDYCYDIRS
ncbi:MAG: type II secretion system protein [Candidatus Paceibacterota bacterium]|jgi:prepilin-type N-terminal cleavage/methylation domain-containing protein